MRDRRAACPALEVTQERSVYAAETSIRSSQFASLESPRSILHFCSVNAAVLLRSSYNRWLSGSFALPGRYAFQIVPGFTFTSASALRVSTMQLDHSANSL